MNYVENPAVLVAWLGFFLALVFGYVANKTSFCTMGAVSDVVNMGDWGRMRAWLLGIAVALLGANLLAFFGYLDLGQTIYTRGTVHWMAALVGGLTFGVGMTLAGGCGQRTSSSRPPSPRASTGAPSATNTCAACPQTSCKTL